MSGIVGSINTRGSGITNLGSAADGQLFTGTGAGLPAGFEAAAGGGKVVQVVQFVEQGVVSVATTTLTTVLTQAITLTNASNKVLVSWDANFGSGTSAWGYTRLYRDSTNLTAAMGDSATGSQIDGTGNVAGGLVNDKYRVHGYSGSFLDTPGGNVTYYLKLARSYGADTLYLNRSEIADDTYAIRTASTLTLLEISV